MYLETLNKLTMKKYATQQNGEKGITRKANGKIWLTCSCLYLH